MSRPKPPAGTRIETNYGAAGNFHAPVHIYFSGSEKFVDFPARIEGARLFLEFLATDCNRLRLGSLDDQANDPTLQTKVGLEAVYVGLDTTTTVKKESPGSNDLTDTPISAFQVVADHPNVVLLGLPGSGKSTFFHHLAFRLARHWCDPKKKDWLEPFVAWKKQPPELIPVVVTLRHLVRGLTSEQIEGIAERFGRNKDIDAAVRDLWNYLEERLHPNCLDVCLPALESAAEAGQILWFFDGLDEVPTESLRAYVRSLVEALLKRYPRARYVLASRIAAYQDPRWKLPGIPIFTLARLDQPKQHFFIDAWFKAHHDHCGMDRVIADGKAARLKAALSDPRRRELREMAGEPMLLTLMALLQTDHRELPQGRAELYEQAVDLLVKRWDSRSDGLDRPPLAELLAEIGSDEKELKRVFWHLALHAQREEFHNRIFSSGYREDLGRQQMNSQARARGTADIHQADLVDFLTTLHPSNSKDWVGQKLIPILEERSGLIIEVGHDERHRPVYAFPHRSFQEYLAAAALTDQPLEWLPQPQRIQASPPPEPVPFPEKAIQLIESSGYWHEVIRWLASELVHTRSNLYDCLNFIKALIPETPTSEIDWNRVWLAGDALADIIPEKLARDRQGRELLNSLPSLLIQLIEEEKLPAKSRALAGMSLGRLGDSREGVGEHPQHGGMPWMKWSAELPSGEFMLGEGPKLRIEAPYRLAVYVVTVAQYELFVKANGYGSAGDARPEWWTKTGWKWRCAEEIQGPRRAAPAFQTPNHPQIGVSWYEALAYCGWLNGFGPRKLGLPAGWAVRLPTEAEWDNAASASGTREYPWVGQPDWARHGNFEETGIGHASAVGLFPAGVAECGCHDLAGNVWEWCQTEWRESKDASSGGLKSLESKEDQGFRGGAWDIFPVSVRASVRIRLEPRRRQRNLGFRVAASPISEL